MAALATVALAGLLRIQGVDHPDRIYFDETYYVTDARAYLDRGVELERPAHPPLGKWVIAGGIAAVGDGPLGWRVANVAAGTATVALVVVAGLLLTRSWWPGVLAGLLVALDGLSFVGSRIAMLDASLTLWVTGAFVLLVIDARRDPPLHPWRLSPWRVAAGVLLGLAVATKWSGVLALAAAFVVAAGVDLARSRAAATDGDDPAPRRAGALAAGMRVVLPLAVVPALAYLAAYAPWLAAYERSETATERCEEGACGTGWDDRLAGLVREHREVLAFHGRLEPTHPARAEPWRWPLLDRPVQFFLERCRPDPSRCPFEPGQERRIIGLGNPALWWPALAIVPLLAWRAVRRPSVPASIVLAFVLLQWLPWFAVKPGYSFYLIPVAPFVALAVALWCWQLRPGLGRTLAVALAVLVVAGFAIWRPLLTGSLVEVEHRERLAVLASWD